MSEKSPVSFIKLSGVDLVERLVEAGFTLEQAYKLVKNQEFIRRHGNAATSKMRKLIEDAAVTYDTTEEIIRERVTGQPAFMHRQHKGILEKIKSAFSVDSEVASRMVLKHPQFAGYGYARRLDLAARAYGSKQKVIRAVVSHPAFLGSLPRKAIERVMDALGCDKARAISVILAHPVIVGFDLRNKIREITEVYGGSKNAEQRVIRAIMVCPQFATKDHAKKVGELEDATKKIGLSRKSVLNILLDHPVMSGYSKHRYQASIEIGEALGLLEKNRKNEVMLSKAIERYSLSPFIPGTKLSLSEFKSKYPEEKMEEPPLMAYLRRANGLGMRELRERRLRGR